MGPLIPSVVLRAGGGGAACMCAILPIRVISRDLAVRGVIKFTAGTGQARPEDMSSGGPFVPGWRRPGGRAFPGRTPLLVLLEVGRGASRK